MATENEARLKEVFADALEPPPNLRLWEWADKYRVLPQKSSHEFGPWRTSRFPFTKEIMDVLSHQDPCQEVCWMKGSQVAATELCINRQLQNIHLRPCPHLCIQKTLDAMKKFSKQRLQDSIDLIPEVAQKLTRTRGFKSGDTIFLKDYPGGILILGGANSAASLRSMPISDLDVDEWDSFKADIDSEGDPAELAVRRTANFSNRKIFYLSTPGKEETSKIEPKFLQGDQRYYHIVCPGCAWKAPIMWKEPGDYGAFTIQYTDDKPKSAVLVCSSCGMVIEEYKKTFMFAPENGAAWVKHNEKGLFPSFHLSALYSPYGFYSWIDAVALWLRANKYFDRELLQVFINTVLGETFAETGKEIFAPTIFEKREVYKSVIPKGGVVLVCGADVHKNKIEAEALAFGLGQESWSIEYKVFLGDTEYDSVWNQFDTFLLKQYQHESGVLMNFAITMVDSGYKTNKVYTFCKYREHRSIFPIKGWSGWGKGLTERPKKKISPGVFLFKAYVDEIKAKFYSQMKVDQPGPGYCHFPKSDIYSEDHFKMLTSERLRGKTIRGMTVLEWILPKGKRNEPLDCRIYAIAGVHIMNPDFDAIAAQDTLIIGSSSNIKKRRTHKPSNL